MSNVEIKQTLTAWALIELQDECGQTLELLIWGEPEDRPDRFKLTSPVKKIVDEVKGKTTLVHTVNSLYRLKGNGLHYRFPVAAYNMLSAGHNPDDVAHFYRSANPYRTVGKRPSQPPRGTR